MEEQPIAHEFHRPTCGRNHWWTYTLTLFLVASGILGFGGLPFQLAIASKGINSTELAEMDDKTFDSYFTLNELFTYNIFPFIAGFVTLLIAATYIHHRSARSFFTLRKQVDFRRFFVGFGIWGGLTSLLVIIQYFSGNGSLVWNFEPENFFALLAITLFLVPIQTGCEELFFRGFLLQFTGPRLQKGIFSIVLNGFTFGALHAFNPEVQQLGWNAFLFYILSGCFATIIAIMDDGIELSWGFHTANNFIGILLVTNNWQVFQTDALLMDTSPPEMGIDMYITLFVWYPLLLLLFSKIYKWKNWKQKILGE